MADSIRNRGLHGNGDGGNTAGKPR